jgi:hypothetical protein
VCPTASNSSASVLAAGNLENLLVQLFQRQEAHQQEVRQSIQFLTSPSPSSPPAVYSVSYSQAWDLIADKALVSIEELLDGFNDGLPHFVVTNGRPNLDASEDAFQTFFNDTLRQRMMVAQAEPVDEKAVLIDTHSTRYGTIGPDIGVWPAGYDTTDITTVQAWGELKKTADLFTNHTKGQVYNHGAVSTAILSNSFFLIRALHFAVCFFFLSLFDHTSYA